VLNVPNAIPQAMPLSALQDAVAPSARQQAVSAQQNFTMFGVTYDQTGAPLGNCAVDLFVTATKVLAASTVSDPTTGAYLLYVSPAFTYKMDGYLVGSPDVAGTTLNTLVPS
jgi:hypothetical protein